MPEPPAHEFDPVTNVCPHCGGLRSSVADDQRSCLPRRPVETGMRPEPSRRQMAYDDAEAISERIRELAAEREAAWNTEG